MGVDGIFSAAVECHGRNPFPVAEMRGVYHHAFSFGKKGIDDFSVFKSHASAQFVLRHVGQPDGLHEIVSKMPVEFFYANLDFCIGKLRK